MQHSCFNRSRFNRLISDILMHFITKLIFFAIWKWVRFKKKHVCMYVCMKDSFLLSLVFYTLFREICYNWKAKILGQIQTIKQENQGILRKEFLTVPISVLSFVFLQHHWVQDILITMQNEMEYFFMMQNWFSQTLSCKRIKIIS